MTTNPGWSVDDLELSDAAKQHLHGQYERYGPEVVLARYAARTPEQAIAEKRERQRLERLEEKRIDFVEQAAYEGRPLRDQFAPLRDYEVGSAIFDAQEERNRQKDTEARAAAAEARVARLREQLAAEKKQSARTAGQAVKYRSAAEKARADAAFAARIALRQDHERQNADTYWR